MESIYDVHTDQTCTLLRHVEKEQRQTDRQTDIDRDRLIERQTERQTDFMYDRNSNRLHLHYDVFIVIRQISVLT